MKCVKIERVLDLGNRVGRADFYRFQRRGFIRLMSYIGCMMGIEDGDEEVGSHFCYKAE